MTTESMFEVNTIAYRLPMSLAVLGYDDRPPYEKSLSRALWRNREAAEAAAKAKLWDSLIAHARTTTELAVLQLHAPAFSTYSNWPDGICEGCDATGYDWEPPEWPCRTMEAMAKAWGIDTPTAQV
jgi:hypothetical protein